MSTRGVDPTETPIGWLVRSTASRQPIGSTVLVILDGVGVGRGDGFDAVATARTPTLDRLCTEGLVRTLRAHGPAVGLASESEMGNSEVGHNTLGAGRIFDQGAHLVDEAIASGRIWGDEWVRLVEWTREHHSMLHLIGLLSDGDVHSSFDHLVALLRRAADDDGVGRIRLHTLLDGRDVPDFTALDYLSILEHELEDLRAHTGCDCRIASGGGRMVTTMDRYGANWAIVEAGWRAHVLGLARPFDSAAEAVSTFRREVPGISDQNLPAFTIVGPDGRPIGPIEDGDAVLVFNFRGDRAIEITEALISGAEFSYFPRERVPTVAVTAMCEYDAERGFPPHYLVSAPHVAGSISELLAEAGVSQFACAETQKFGHVTYFWNGNRSEKFDEDHETYLEIPSDQVPFEQRPAMKSDETADALISAIEERRYEFLRANFAGGDMVGHTGDFAATRRAIEAIDAALGRVAEAVRLAGGCLVITADHGNAEDMVQRNADGSVCVDTRGQTRWKTSHSCNPVRFIVRDFGARDFRLRDDLPRAGLANVAATLLELLGFVAPSAYEPSLLDWSEKE